jgi:hypothetical protein
MRTWITLAVLTAATFGFVTDTAKAQPGSDRSLVESWYLRYLGRPADPIGLGDQIEALRQGTTPSVVEASILSGSEYYHRNGGTPEGFVIALYRDVLSASPNSTDVAVLSQRAIVSGRNAVATQVLNMRPTYVAPVTAYSLPPTVVVQPAPITVVRTVPAYRVYVPPPVYYYSPGISVRLRLGR